MQSIKTLIVEDEFTGRLLLQLTLEKYGEVHIAVNGREAVEAVHLAIELEGPYDLICLDLTMPGIDGLEVCSTLRADPGAGFPPRILMLTARDTVEDRIRGLDVGADDYLVKPFAFDELSARIRSLLRRDPGRSGAVLEVGDVVLDTARHRARRNDRDLDLTAKEFALLRYFMSRPGEVVSQEVLLDHVWDEHADPFTNTVRVTVGTLRRKLSMDGEAALLETVVGSGYRLLDGDDVR